jgi:DUF971 family protein
MRFSAADKVLRVSFDDGYEGEIPFELLRVKSPSAETRGHGGETPPPPAGKKDIGVTSATHVGRYAVRIEFSDGHDTGLYTWALLKDLAQNADAHFDNYLQDLTAASLSRV